jgi:hypothetical protein
VGHTRGYLPGTSCDVIFIDGSPTHASVSADLAGMRALAAPHHVLVVNTAGTTATDAGRAWLEAVDSGAVQWAGTLLESPSWPDGDGLVYGEFSPQTQGQGQAHADVPVTP